VILLQTNERKYIPKVILSVFYDFAEKCRWQKKSDRPEIEASAPEPVDENDEVDPIRGARGHGGRARGKVA